MSSRRLAMSVLASCVLSVSTLSAQEYRWDLANEYQPNSVHAQAADVFIAEVTKLTDGAITITAHHGGALGFNSLDQFDTVGDGAVDLASSFVGPWSGIHPLFLLSSLPFLAPTPQDARALYEASKPYYESVLEDSNQIFLYATPWPPSGFWGNKPIDNVDALRNLRIRTYDPNGTITMRNVGAAPIQLSWADTAAQLATGGIDAVLTSADNGASTQLWDHQTHFTEVNYASPLQIVHMHRPLFEQLSEERQQQLVAAAKKAEDFGWALALGDRVQENYEQMRSHGMVIVTDVSREFIDTLTEAGQEAGEDWKKKFGADAEALLADYEARRAQ